MARTRFSCRTLFQSTHTLRSAAYFFAIFPNRKGVSIHALLAERDLYILYHKIR